MDAENIGAPSYGFHLTIKFNDLIKLNLVFTRANLQLPIWRKNKLGKFLNICRLWDFHVLFITHDSRTICKFFKHSVFLAGRQTEITKLFVHKDEKIQSSAKRKYYVKPFTLYSPSQNFVKVFKILMLFRQNL